MPLASFDFVSPADLLATTTAFFGGTIKLDPASSDIANTVVGADRYFTPKDDGLNQQWKAENVYLYPPREFVYDHERPPDPMVFERRKKFQKSAQRVWLEEAYRKYIKKEFNEAIIFLTSSDVALLTTQKINFDFPLCVLKDKPKLLVELPDLPALRTTRCIGFVYYLPCSKDTEKRIYEFSTFYSTLGRVFV